MKKIILLSLMFASLVQAQVPSRKIIFVPGAHFDGNSFNALTAQISNSKAVDFDIFTSGLNLKNITIDHYAKIVCDAIKKSQSRVVLAGHSQGGAVMNHVLGICPKRIDGLIYIAATIPQSGEKPFALLRTEDDEFYFNGVTEDKEAGLFRIKDHEAFVEAFAPDGNAKQKQVIRKIARDEPIGPSHTVISFDLKNFESLKKLVITTRNDRIISSGTQKLYYERIREAKVVELESGHLPMVTNVNELQKIIISFRDSL